MNSLAALVDALRASRGFAHKRDLSGVIGTLASSLAGGTAALSQAVGVGDDCAAIADGDGHLLFAIEGLTEDFVTRMPWFAGWCGVMVNLSDIAAMGGRAIAVVDALWSRGDDPGSELLKGMAAASQAYGVPLVGGHSHCRSERGQLAVAVLGRAGRNLLSSFDARPGDTLLVAVDLRGAYQEPYPYWNAATDAPAARLRADLDLLPALAETGLATAAKDISMAGVLGTALMLLECSRVGARIDLDALPRPPQVSDDDKLLRWLCAFPSYGFVLSVRPEQADAVRARFAGRDIACAAVGTVDRGSRLVVQRGAESATLWDWQAERFITAPES